VTCDNDCNTFVYVCDLCLCSGAKRVGVNPKVNNMVQGYEFARHDLILISDCGLRGN